MRFPSTVCALLSALSLTGCCYSTQPIYTPETLKKDLDLAGTWESIDPEARSSSQVSELTVNNSDDGGFQLRWHEADRERVVPFHAIQIDRSLYLDVKVADDPALSLDTVHLIYLVKLEGDHLFVAQLDGEPLKKAAAKRHLAYSSFWHGVRLEASTGDLQAFLADCRDEVFVFAGELRRKGPQSK